MVDDDAGSDEADVEPASMHLEASLVPRQGSLLVKAIRSLATIATPTSDGAQCECDRSPCNLLSFRSSCTALSRRAARHCTCLRRSVAGAARDRRGRLYWLGRGAVLVLVYNLTDWDAKKTDR